MEELRLGVDDGVDLLRREDFILIPENQADRELSEHRADRFLLSCHIEDRNVRRGINLEMWFWVRRRQSPMSSTMLSWAVPPNGASAPTASWPSPLIA